MPRKLLLIFLLAVSVRLLFFCIAYEQSGRNFHVAVPHLDGYYEIAQNLLAGNGFTGEIHPPFIPDVVRTPLYPLLIAVLIYVFKSYYAVLIAQIIIGSIIPLLAYRIAFQLTEQKRIATIVAVLLAFEPFSIMLSLTILSETFFTALFLAGIMVFLDYLKTQNSHAVVCATGFFALATLARPTIQFLPLLLILTIFWLSRKNIVVAIKHSVIVIVIFLLILSPWIARNFVKFGNPALSVQYASVPYDYFIPSVLALEERIGFIEAQQKFNHGIGGIPNGVEDITLVNAPYYKKHAAEILKKHPIGIIKSVGVTFFTFFTHDGYMDVLRRIDLAPSIRLERPAFIMLLESPKKAFEFILPLIKSPALFVILGRVLWIIISLFFFIGVIQYLKRPWQRVKGIFISLVILYFALTTIAVGLSVNARFRMPVNALILTFAVYGIYEIIKHKIHNQQNPLSKLVQQVSATLL